LQHFNKVETEITHLEWKDENMQEKNLVAQNEIGKLVVTNTQENPAKCNKVQCKNVANNNKKSLRTRKMPSTKSKDFLW
jgi:hypothetical protein